MILIDQLIFSIGALSWGRTLGLGCMVAALYFALFYSDASGIITSTEAAKKEIVELEKQIAVTKEAIANADRFENEVKNAVEQFTRITDFMPEKLGVIDLMSTLTELSGKAGLKLVKTEPRTSSDRGEFYDTVKLSVGLEGSYTQIALFLSYLSQMQRFISFERFDIAPAASSDPELPKLIMEGLLVGYRYRKEGNPTNSGAGKPASSNQNSKGGADGGKK